LNEQKPERFLYLVRAGCRDGKVVLFSKLDLILC
jgi:hypothetical protein